MEQSWVGRPIRRLEDGRLLTGGSRFTDDISLPGMLHAWVVRSPHPHATISGTDRSSALAQPGVRLVLTAEDIEGEVKPIPSYSQTPPFDIASRDDKPAADASQFPLARGRVRYLGEPVALVVAETYQQARDAAELIAVDYEVLPAVIDLEAALAPGAPLLWDELDSNVSFKWEGGDASAVDRAFAGARHVVRLRLDNNRVVIAFMEPRSVVADVDTHTGRVTVFAGCQSAHSMKTGLCNVLGLLPEQLRVVVPDTGGAFGARGGVYPELVLAAVAARRLGCAVKWTSGRDEAFLADTQARDHVLDVELGLDAEGRFIGLRTRIDWRHGAYLTARSIYTMIKYLTPTLGGPYRIPALHVTMRGIFSNTTPLAALRDIGGVEANYLMESVIDAAARVTGLDRLALRRVNVADPSERPFRTAGGNLITSGRFAAHLERAVLLADWEGFPSRRKESESRGVLRGIGLGLYVENDGGAPSEFAEIDVGSDDKITIRVGTQDFGMGHVTMYAQILADILDVRPDEVSVVFGDTDVVQRGAGAHGSRSARIGGGAVVKGAQALLEAGKAMAAELLEVAPQDIQYAGGKFVVGGTDRAASRVEVAQFAEAQGTRTMISLGLIAERTSQPIPHCSRVPVRKFSTRMSQARAPVEQDSVDRRA